MFARIEVKDRKEAEAITRGLSKPDVRAFVLICGTLDALPTDRSLERVLRFVADRVDEDVVELSRDR